jgi:hypothetical protein
MRIRLLAAAVALAVAWGALARAEGAWQATEGRFTLHHDVMRNTATAGRMAP